MKTFTLRCRARRGAAAAAALFALMAPAHGAGVPAPSAFKDPLDHPAPRVTEPQLRPMMAVARAGARIVAVGSRGLVVVSDDQGASWTQARVPVQSDLVAVQFPNASDGWAVGHDGVILHSADGGASWTKQLDGRMAATRFRAFYAKLVADGAPDAARVLAQVERNFKSGPALPYLDVWFSDSLRGYAVGAFGMIAATVDGGKTWEPWLHRIDNPEFLNLNGIRGVGERIYVVGEQGTVYALDGDGARFGRAQTGYAGSFFGVAGNERVLLAFGLRGNVYRSEDQGRRWEAVKTGSDATVMGGAAAPDQGGFVLVNSAGLLLLGGAAGHEFKPVQPARPMRYTNLAILDDRALVLTGLAGVRVEPRPAAQPPTDHP
ncbi:WD40/YVTN/BNR-like repeat-containing protein [Pseudoduganella namucuonensis]|uniref:Photosynthesis system II assembly factor Ycf48/Hcf136-like domain-containing protein n=1 Tax=Pseudoduganella namucuonensis TaxID=1035707 RepID=A0A1I7KYU3_9BURK|nr:YCF48-related protein [Pseudoduganella namucuonensis]SFV02629.1 Uncharacterized protein SAMN05216552_102137 [Pseudoduganella namucuonensis]